MSITEAGIGSEARESLVGIVEEPGVGTDPILPDSSSCVTPFVETIVSQRSSLSDVPLPRTYVSRATTLVASRGLIDINVTELMVDQNSRN